MSCRIHPLRPPRVRSLRPGEIRVDPSAGFLYHGDVQIDPRNLSDLYLVGGLNPSEKYESQLG